MGKKRGKTVKLSKKKDAVEDEEIVKAPHSFVIKHGNLGKSANNLMLNFRKIMEPFTASHLKVTKTNVVKDFVHIAGPLNVTHLIMFTKSDVSMKFHIAKIPHGPTLTFQIKEYILMRDIISSQKKSVMYSDLFEHHPLLVLNNFSGEGMHFKLMATTFQNMFPSINVNKIKLNAVKRCLLLNYNNEDNTIELRHYAIKVVPTGLSKAVKKLIQRKVPNLGQLNSMEEYLQKDGNLSESEAEMDGPSNTVVLPQTVMASKGNKASEKSAIRLYEIGPRIKFQLFKIQEGLMSGEVLFHSIVSEDPEEIKALKAKLKARKLLKAKRKKIQGENVKKKKAEEEKKEAKDPEADEAEDLEWYREEVGEDPDENTLMSLKRSKADSKFPAKKRFKKASSKKRL